MHFFAETLNLDELCLLMLSVPEETEEAETKHSRNQKCRQLISSEARLIGAPHDIHSRMIHVIVQRSFYESGELRVHLPRLGLKEEKVMTVTSRDYQVCFHYTLLVKLAPHWNQMGSTSSDEGIVLVQGANFLTTKKTLPALKVDVVVVKNEIQISLQAFMVKMPLVKFINFGVSSRVAKEFSSKQIDVILDNHIKRQWCNILPTFKIGQLKEISREIPSYSNFKDYAEIRSFWKNNYGYQLPTRNDFYYGVYFTRLGKTFIFPRCCILPAKPNMWLCTETNASQLYTFIKDVNMKMAVVCAQGLNFIPRNLRIPMTLLPTAQVEGESDRSLNLPAT